jgi:hypothetical protein
MEPTSRERQARYDTAEAWQRRYTPITEQGEDLLARRQAMEAQHAIERRQWETEYAHYLMQVVMPLERKNAA